MKASALPAAALLVVLAGCSAADEPGETSESTSPEPTTSSPRAPTEPPETSPPIQNSFPDPADAKPDIPNIALRKDGKTPLSCSEWPGLSDGRQRDIVFSALVQSFVIPITDPKVNETKQTVDVDCRSRLVAAAYMVALRAARNM